MNTAPRMILVLALLTGMSTLGFARKLNCPDSGEELRHRDVMATSAPEIKVRAAAQEDSHRWGEIVKPLIKKATTLAKAQRSSMIQEGIERGCVAPQVYVSQMMPTGDKVSGCDHRVVTRPGDDGFVWLQVVATCKYDWVCCTPEDGKAPGSAGYTLEGPLGSTPPATPAKK